MKSRENARMAELFTSIYADLGAIGDQQLGVQALKARFMNSVAIAAFATAPIKPKDVLNILIDGILARGVFQLEYNELDTVPVAHHTIPCPHQ